MKTAEILRSESIYLRNLDSSDVTEQYVQWLHNPEVNRYLDVQKNLPTLNQQKNYVQKIADSSDKLLFGIFTFDNKLIGSTKLHFYEAEKVEIGIMIGDLESQGKGYGKSTVNLLIALAGRLGIKILTAGYDFENLRSANLFKSCGFAVIEKKDYGLSADCLNRVIRTILKVN